MASTPRRRGASVSFLSSVGNEGAAADSNNSSPSSRSKKNKKSTSASDSTQLTADMAGDKSFSESIPAWARRGVSWRGIREVFDDQYVSADAKTEDVIELEEANLNETMQRYSVLYDEVGLQFLHETCADVPVERVENVRRHIQDAAEEKRLGASVASLKQMAASASAAGSSATISGAAATGTTASGDDAAAAAGGSVAFCFNCRQSGHTHGICPQPRRCYICHDPRHDAFVCVANPVAGSEFYFPAVKCHNCGEKGHDIRRCKARGGPWQGKPGYAHLPDTTYPRPVVIHVGDKKGGGGGGGGDAVAEVSMAKDVICRLFQQFRSEDYALVKLMREAELFCAALPLLAVPGISGVQRTSLRHALDILRPAISGVDIATFGVARPSATAMAPRPGRAVKGEGNVLDDEAALNELRTSSMDFNVVFASRIERYGRSQNSAEFRVGLQQIQADCGLAPTEMGLLHAEDDEIAYRINKEVVAASKKEAEREREAMAAENNYYSGGGGGGGGADSSRGSSRASSRLHHQQHHHHHHRSQHHHQRPRSAASDASSESKQQQQKQSTTSAGGESGKKKQQQQQRKGSPSAENTSSSGNKKVPRPPPSSTGSRGSGPQTRGRTGSSSPTNQQQQQQSLNSNVFRGTIIRQMKNLDPVAAEKRARSRREAAGEATLMRWTRLLASGTRGDVHKVTAEEAASSSNTNISRAQLRMAAEQDLLRLMKAAVNKGDSNVVDGKRLQVPRVQHGTIGRDSIIRAWAEQGAKGAPGTTSTTAAARASSSSASRRRSPAHHHQQQQQDGAGDGTFLTRQGRLDSSSYSSAELFGNSVASHPAQKKGAVDDSLTMDGSGGGFADGLNSPVSGDSPSGRSNLVFAGVKLQHDKDEPIRNWNAHRVAMAWGKEQEDEEKRQKQLEEIKRRKEAGIVAESKEERERERKLLAQQQGGVRQTGKIDVWLHAKDRYEKCRGEAEATLERRLGGARREEREAARREYDQKMHAIGWQRPPIADVIDPAVVDRWRSRFQTSRIRAGVKDAAIKDSRQVHRSVVATARLGGAAICDGATKRAERWLRSHRDVETEDATTNMISDNSSAWTVLCHRIAIAAVRVKAKRELADELHGFLQRLPRGGPTQDESVRMVHRFERLVYGDDDGDEDEEQGVQRANSGFLDGASSEAGFSSVAAESPHVKWLSSPRIVELNTPRGNGMTPLGQQPASAGAGGGRKTNLDRCLEEWMGKRKPNPPAATAIVSDPTTPRAAARTARSHSIFSNTSLLSDRTTGRAPAAASAIPRPPSATAPATAAGRPGSATGDRRPQSSLSNRSGGGAGGVPPSSIGEKSAGAASHSSRTANELDRLLSAPVTAKDVEILIQRACTESYSALFDGDDFTRMAMPSTMERWAPNDPRRMAPRTQEGESVAAFLRWLVSPGAVEGMIGRVVSKNSASGEYQFGGE